MSPAMGWLDRLLQLMPVRGQLDLRCQYGAPWRIEQGPSSNVEMAYHVVLKGSAELVETETGGHQWLEEGDLLLVTDGGAHTLHDGSGHAPSPESRQPAANLVYGRNEGSGTRTDVLCGRFSLDISLATFLRRYLPGRLVVRAGGRAPGSVENGISSLHAIVDLMSDESAADLSGARVVLDALSTALFTAIVRFASKSDEAPPGLLALAGSATVAPALNAVVGQPEIAWTLPLLATQCGISRATLSRLLRIKSGRPAGELFNDIRMLLSAKALRTSTQSTAAIAKASGFRSEVAFRRAFKSHTGITPARWRKAP